MKQFRWVALLALTGLAAACGDDDPTGPGAAGSFDLEVTGAYNETAEGPAWFGSDEDEEGDPVFVLLFGDDDSRHVVIAGKSGSERPAVGVYDIGEEAWSLAHIVSNNDELLALFSAVEGQVQITESSSSRVRGTITYVATGLVGQAEAEVEGSLTFDARFATNATFQTTSAVRSVR